MPEKFFPGVQAVVDDEARVQRGEHAGKFGTVRVRVGDRVFVVPWPGASWVAFWVDVQDVAIVRQVAPHIEPEDDGDGIGDV